MGRKMKAEGFSSLLVLLLIANTNGRHLSPSDDLLTVESWIQGIPSTNPPTLRHHCTLSGVFPAPGSCRDFFQCDQLHATGPFSIHLFSCPPGTIFNMNTLSCVSPSSVTSPPTCNGSSIAVNMNSFDTSSLVGPNVNALHPLSRSKRALTAVFAGLSTLASFLIAGNGIFGSITSQSKKRGGVGDLRVLEKKLLGVEGKIKDVHISVLENQIEAKMNSQMTQSLIAAGTRENQGNFEMTQRLINRGFLENRINSAAIQGLITQGNINNQLNFAKVQVSIGELQQFINEEITEAKAAIEKGFDSISTSIDLSRIEPLVSELLTLIKGFHEKSSHLKSLSDTSRKDEIERTGGYLEYLESSPLQDTLYDIIQQNFAVPKTASDLTAVFILDLLLDGLQVHASMLSSIVSANVYLASEALDRKHLDEFNTYMFRVQSAVTRVKVVLGYGDRQGLIAEVSTVLKKVQQLPFSARVQGLHELLSQKLADISQLESYIEDLVIDNTELSIPGKIIGKPNFTTSMISVPLGPWKADKQVSYAVQFISERGLSQIGEWSTPYTIQDKANPTIQVARAETGIARLLYRRFDEENPELVGAIDDNEQTLFRDISRELLNAAARPNEDLAVKEIMPLIADGADINTWLEDGMTPLHYAANHGNVEVMDILIKKTADIHAKASDNQEPLHFAALFGAKEGIEYLLSKGASINAQTRLLGLSSLHIAVANSHTEATRALMKNGAFINIKDNNGLTPLHLSIAGNGDTIDVLLESVDLDINAVAEDGLTPLHYAARSSSDIFVENLLLDTNTDVNAVSDSLLTPLHLAAIGGNADIIAVLAQSGARLSSVDKYGSTPLHYASFYGNKRAVLVLMNLDPTLEDVNNIGGKTAANLAVENFREEVMEILRSDDENLIVIMNHEFGEKPTVLESDPAIGREIELSTPSSSCSNEVANKMAKGSEETCTHIEHVESYVNQVMSMIPLQRYYRNQEDFSQIFQDYDNDLIAGKDHAKIWRNGDSIVNGIRLTFELARKFDPEFTRKYKINQQRVKRVTAGVDQVKEIEEVKRNIETLEEQIQNATQAMKKVEVEDVLVFFRGMIAGYNTQLKENKRKLKEDFTLIAELKELVDFLEFVRSDSLKIQEVAVKTRGKIETFRDHLEHDKGAFERHGRVASDSIQRLTDESVQRNGALAENKRKVEELEVKIEQERKEVKIRFERINESQNQLLEMRRNLMDQMKSSRTWKIVGAVLTPLIIGIPILINANNEEKKYTALLQETLVANKEQIETITQDIQTKYSEIETFRQLVANSSSNSAKIRNEMLEFITIDGDLKILSDDVQTLLTAIKKAIDGVKVIKDVFDDVTKKLGEMIEKAETAKTEAERMNAKYFIYNELSLLECNWKDVYLKVMNLDECTRTFYVKY